MKTKTYTESVNFRLKPEIKAWLESKAKTEERSMNFLVNKLLTQLMLDEKESNTTQAA